MASEPRLPLDGPGAPLDAMIARDEAARAVAVDPARNVVLEASAGTGKTHVLVTRYINLLRAGVNPANILAITFTRKAAAEMRERIVRDLRALARQSAADEARWRALRERVGDIAISTIDAFCFSLLREFPLEADLDPGFDIADETVVPRLVEEALDGTLRAARRMARKDADIALLMSTLGERRARLALGALIDRRLTAGPTIGLEGITHIAVGPRHNLALRSGNHGRATGRVPQKGLGDRLRPTGLITPRSGPRGPRGGGTGSRDSPCRSGCRA